MKKKIIFFMILLVPAIIFNCCKKNDSTTTTATTTKTTGHLYVKLTFGTSYGNGMGCCSDTSIAVHNFRAFVKTEAGTLINTVSGNNTTIDCGELNPGNYMANGEGHWTALAANGSGACTSCPTAIEMTETLHYVTFQIVANQDQTITCH